ncbi:MAG: hypothetical protein JEZ11_06695 [Desulfobacterales bacterium]|nr:hypothetical protein [Desulfobacterales bacterium]
MKWFAIAAAGLAALLVAVYGVLFTEFGNSLVSPLIASSIGKKIGLKVRVEKYELRIGRFALALALDDTNRIETNGIYTLFSQAIDASYRVRLDDLERLAPLTRRAMKGRLHTKGTVRGNQKKMSVSGSSDIAGSDTVYDFDLKELKPDRLMAKIKGADLSKLLYMGGQPDLAGGKLDADLQLVSLDPEKLQGTIVTTVSNGTVNRDTMSKAFDLKMPETDFNADTKTLLNGNLIDTTASVTSTIGTLVVKQARFNVKETLLTSDYRADIADLDRLFFVTGRHLKGAMGISGDVKKGKDLVVTAHAETLGGALDARLLNDDLHADLKALQTLAMLRMLIYPQVFQSALTGTLDYNLKAKKGTLDTTLSDGRFVPTVMTTLIAQLARFDLTREVFQGKLTSHIDGEQILSDVDLRAANASVTGNNARLNAQTRQIDARLKIVANDNPLDVIIRGDVAKPKVDVDVKNLLQREAERYIEKQAGGQIKNLLKGLFK